MPVTRKLSIRCFRGDGQPFPGIILQAVPADERGWPTTFYTETAMICVNALEAKTDETGLALLNLVPNPEGSFYKVSATARVESFP